MTTLRCSYIVDIFFNELTSFRAKAYAVASEAAVSLPQVHASCGGKVAQQFFCAGDDAVVPKAALAKQYRFPDGTETLLTDETIKSADSERLGQLQILECVPEGSVAPTYFGKTLFLGPDDGERGGDPYSTLVDVLEETRTCAIGMHFGSRRDQLMLIERFGARGLLMRELFYATEMRPIEEIRLPTTMRNAVSVSAGIFDVWKSAVQSLRKPSFSADAYKDGYPDRLLAAAQRSAGIGVEAGAAESDAPTPILKAARLKVATGSTKGAREEKREGGGGDVRPSSNRSTSRPNASPSRTRSSPLRFTSSPTGPSTKTRRRVPRPTRQEPRSTP
jgi:DNA end-binding protein Ku